MSNLLNLDLLTSEDTMSAALALLYSLKGVPEYSVMSELPYILDYNNFIKFIKYYEGRTIRIPTFDEISQMFKILILYQKSRVEGLPWAEAIKIAGYSQEESLSCRSKLSAFESLLKSQEIGGRTYE